METQEDALSLGGGETSPSKRKHESPPPGADRRLVARDPDEAPAWVEILRLSLAGEMQSLGETMRESFEGRLQQESSTRQAEMTEVNKRLDDLAGRIEQISKQRGENFQAVPPPDPWARATFASSSATGSDAWSNYKPAANAPHPARPATNASSPAQPPPLQRQQPQPQPNAFSDTGSGPGSAEAQGTNYNNVILALRKTRREN